MNDVVAFAVASLLVALSPGPSWLFVTSAALRWGPPAGFVAVAGNAVGILCHAGIAAAGLPEILRRVPDSLATMQCLGALCLVLMGVRVIWPSGQPQLPNSVPPDPHVFRWALITNLLNPKVSLLLWSLLPQLVDQAGTSGAARLFLFGLLHAVIASSVLSTLVVACRQMLHSGRAASLRRIFVPLSGGLLILTGGFLFLQAWNSPSPGSLRVFGGI